MNKDFLNMHEDFTLVLDVASVEDIVLELGFSPREVSIINVESRIRLDWDSESGVAIHTAAAGTRTIQAGSPITAYAGATKVGYTDATASPVTYKNVETGAAIDADLYIQVSRTSSTSITYGAGGSITTTFTEGVKSLGLRLPALTGNVDNGNTYVTKPGIRIDVSATGSAIANGEAFRVIVKR